MCSASQKYRWNWLIVLTGVGLALGLAGVNVEAKTLNVANNGVDSATCGDQNNPCRSISKAIENASAGDRIVVGPGRYGDLDGDGTFGETGEETARVGSGCFCMIRVNKRLTIESRDGAGATVLDAGGANVSVVKIQASGVVFGKKNKGFTLTHGIFGLYIDNSTTGVRVTGNLAIANTGAGFYFNFGNNDNNRGHQLQDNAAIANGSAGFVFGGSRHQLRGNLATANNGDGFNFEGSGHLLSGNIATANRFDGFDIFGNGHLLTGNLAVANGGAGFTVTSFSKGHVLSGNGSLGNRFFGILILIGASATITNNNIFGNNSVPAPPPNFSGETNCGLSNRSGTTVDARNNFWGTATGPGTLTTPRPEPADNVCDDPAFPGSSTAVTSFAIKEFKVQTNSVLFLQESTQLAPAASGGKTLFVANNGLDVLPSGFCGDKDHPCRSISKAIENASTGDKIVVGPGRYGDLDGDTDFNDPGEEKAEMGTGCLCMIKVNEQLVIESRDGAGATVLDAGGASLNVVHISASGTVFGKKKKGFTLTGAGTGFSGLVIADGTSGVKVGGNLATRNGFSGFDIFGSGHLLSGNLATRNQFGFVFFGSGHQLTGNLATANDVDGFDFSGSGHVLTGNIASANAVGFDIFGSGHLLSGNIASANGFDGFQFGGSGHVLTGNGALGNGRFGIFVAPGASATINKNNIFGNNAHPEGLFTNCGLLNQSGNTIDATNNFWGAFGPGHGPGPEPANPADNVRDDFFNFPGSHTIDAPVAHKEFKTLSPVEEPGLVAPADSMEKETLPVQLIQAMQTKDGLLFRALGDADALRLEIMDLAGRRVYDSEFVKGHALRWIRVNSQNRPIANGIYLYRLTARDREGREIQSELRKLIIRR